MNSVTNTFPNEANFLDFIPVAHRTRKKRTLESFQGGSLSNTNVRPLTERKVKPAKKARIKEPVKSEETFAVRVLAASKFIDKKLPDLASRDLFTDRLAGLAKLFTPVAVAPHEKPFAQLWMEIPKGFFAPVQEPFYLNCLLFEDVFSSNAVAEGEFEGEKEGESCHFLKIFEDEDLTSPLLQLRWSHNGSIGELCHIQKGEKISGNQVKSICFSILNALKIEMIYLNDDSKMTFALPPNGPFAAQKTVRMAEYLPIVTADGDSWYGKEGFSPLYCNGVVAHDGKTEITQDPAQYYRSLEFLRGTSLEWFSTLLSTEENDIVQRLVEKYLAPEWASAVPHLKLSSKELIKGKTVHQLGSAIYRHLIDKNIPDKVKILINRDFVQYCGTFLEAIRDEKKGKQYNDALDQYCSTTIWRKFYCDSGRNTSFKDFLSKYRH